MIKKLSILATFLLIIGIIGVLFTFDTKQEKADKLDEKIIEVEDVQDVIVEADNADITILPTDDKNAKVTLFGSDKSHKFTAGVAGNVLNIQSKSNRIKLFSFDFFSSNLALTVYLPQGAYEKVYASSSNGKITMQELSGADILLSTMNGRIEINELQGETVFVETYNGKIAANDVNANKITMESDNGNIQLNNIEAEVIAETNNGKINLYTPYLNYPTEMHSDNGKIEIKTDKEPNNVIYDLKTHNGKISVLGKKDWDVKVGNGDNVIKLSTDNGSINITN